MSTSQKQPTRTTSLKNASFGTTYIALALCLLPLLLYALVFSDLAYNVNYIAYDDITILDIIPGFEDAAWPERWRRLTELFPEHRLVFSRSVVLFFYRLTGQINLVWLMVVGNLAWAACACIFYASFRRLGLSLWYFVPVMWLWFQIQSFENIFWGVSSLCNFGVLFFSLLAFYIATYHPQRLVLVLVATLLATFTYGNGMMLFPVLALVYWITGHRRSMLGVLIVAVLTFVIYFIDFTPVTPSMDVSDPVQLRDGVAGFFGFIGSIFTLWGYAAYTNFDFMLPVAVGAGILLVVAAVLLLRKKLPALVTSLWNGPVALPPTTLFALAILLFVAITTTAVVYKRIPNDQFEGMFKGRYRMYSALWLVALYLGTLSLYRVRREVLALVSLLAIGLNLVILYANYATAVNNQRQAVVHEFNTRYNADWLGLKMFGIDRAHFEKIRAYYQSGDPFAEGWSPGAEANVIPCRNGWQPDSIWAANGGLLITLPQNDQLAPKNYLDGTFVLLQSDRNVYLSAVPWSAGGLRNLVMRFRYFTYENTAYFDQANIQPGTYRVYLLVRQGGQNRIYCTDRQWVETD
jgi:hypothetical protein